MEIDGVEIEDTFAEAFPMVAARAIVTAASPRWAQVAAQVATGYATSVISCDAEAGVERTLSADETPDGRPGVALLFFGFSRDKLEGAVAGRVGQCVMTCPTAACYNGLPVTDKSVKIGGSLRYFGDGFQMSKLLEAEPAGGPSGLPAHLGQQQSPDAAAPAGAPGARRRYWRIPVMDGEFLCEDRFGTAKGVAGGNFLILAASQAIALDAAERAVAAIAAASLPVITPFPGGIVRSGSKVGSRYKKLRASTNDAYCPTLRGLTQSALPDGVQAAYEVVIDGLTLAAVEQATRVGVRAACRPGVLRISAGNYGGTLGPFPIHLHRVLGQAC